MQDYLALARAGAVEPSVQDLGAAVQEWTGEVQDLAAQHGVSLQLAGLETAGALTFHASTLRRAVLNVVHNALEAMPQGGSLTLEGVRTTTAVQLRVRDSGTGIAAERVTRIFEPLYTAKPGGDRHGPVYCAADPARPRGHYHGGECGGAGQHLYPHAPPAVRA